MSVGGSSQSTYVSEGDAYSQFSAGEENWSDEEFGTDQGGEPPVVAGNWDQEFANDAIEFQLVPDDISSQLGITSDSSPLDILKLFISEDIVLNICEESARYAQQKQQPHFVNFEPPELWRFLAIKFSMGIIRKANIKSYWSTSHVMRTPFFAETMSRDRFLSILRSLHFVDNERISPNETDRFVKLGTFADALISNFKRAVNLGEFLCLDESIVPFKGRLAIKQYNPKKRSRFGVKLFILADCDSKMIYDILPYQGSSTKIKHPELIRDLGYGGATVDTLLEPHFEKGHKVVVDNWFNSPKLARRLREKKTYVLGTVQKTRKDMPKGRRVIRKLNKGEVEVFSDGGILVERWADRREVYMLNSFLSHSMEDCESPNPRNSRPKPASVVLYNSKMGVVDDSDKVISPHCSTRKTYKWYRKVAFHFLDLAMYNSLQLYNKVKHEKVTYARFVEMVAENIISSYPKPLQAPRGRPRLPRDELRLNGKHIPEQAMNVKDGHELKSRSNCTYCCKVLDKRKATSFKCKQCDKYLCINGSSPNCFELYHSDPVLRKRRRIAESEVSENSYNIFENSEDIVFSES